MNGEVGKSGDSVVDELLAQVAGSGSARRVTDVRVGLAYTVVRLDDGSCGIAMTFREEMVEGYAAIEEAGRLAGLPALDLAEWARELKAAPAALGVATINALLEPPSASTEGDVRELIRIGPDDVVGMVGRFGPLVDRIRSRAASLHIFERRMEGKDDVHPDWAAPVLLPRCDVVIVSATTVINRTLEPLLVRAEGAREVVVMGPSAPLAPDVFRKRGVSLLAGVQILDADRVLRIVSEGGGTRQFGPAVRKLSVRIEAR
ncbi:MAG: DUF364 domain-containing protein [Candidatus Latescibacteria bacterium]|jgi:hypothetical protein|nr:DUF364 domain-containing protein [Candidatus Latescibacterota bacterium]